MEQHRLDTARVFERIIEIYRRFGGVLLGVALVTFLIAAVVTGIVSTSGSISGALIGLALTMITSFVYDAMVVELVNDVQDGRLDQSVGGMLRSVVPVLPTLIGASLLAGLGIVLGFMALIVPGFVLLAWWALVAPVVIIERSGAVEALGRSRRLVRGNGWRVFGVLVVILFINAVVGGLFDSIGGDSVLLGVVFSLLGNALLAPLHGIAVATMYFELKPASVGSTPTDSTLGWANPA